MKILIKLRGVRPLMFDRYPGDNNTQLRPEEKFYKTAKGELFLPSINLYSLLVAENTKSASKQYCGKQWRNVSHQIASATNIEPFEIPITAEGKKIVFKDFNDKIYVHKCVARVKKGGLSIPSPKERPVINTPWEIEFTMELLETKDLSFTQLRNLFEYAGTMGIGTFRPFYGRFEVEKFELLNK
jgi:hypothetical protein